MKTMELIIDNFAGGGGASTGIEAALGRPIDIAINHDPEAIAMHQVNHPETKHLCESVWDVNPVEVCAGRPVGLAWFSPDCTHFSKAKGGKPVKKKIRGLAWVVLRWAATVRPRVIMLENVEEFVTWGPLVQKDGKHYPCPKRKGRTFRTFVNALEKHGYTVDYRAMRACDYGAPTIRKRLFLIARYDGQPIVWPEPTHGDPKTEAVKSGRLKPWRTAAECIDWSIPCPSIFERKKPLAEATLRRIAKGIMKYVVNSPEPFIVTYYGDKSGEFRGQDMNDPLRTQTTENRHALVTPFLSSAAYSKTTGRGKYIYPPEEPVRTITSSNDKILVTPFLARTDMHKSNAGCAYDIEDPLRTVTSTGGHALVSAFLAKHYGGVVGSEAEKPMGTVTSIDHHSLVAANLVWNMGQSIGADLNEPMHTVTSKDRFGLVTIYGEEYQITDIGMRMLAPRELFRAQGFRDSYIIDRDINGKPLTKTTQVAKCGNSVSPPHAEALVRANYPGKEGQVAKCGQCRKEVSRCPDFLGLSWSSRYTNTRRKAGSEQATGRVCG